MAVNISLYQHFPNGLQHPEHSPDNVHKDQHCWVADDENEAERSHVSCSVMVTRPGVNVDLLTPCLVISPLDIFLFSFENVDSLLERKIYKHYTFHLLSEVGEKYVDEEVKKALIGIKQMKIMMEKNEDKHIDLMKTLKKSSEEKQQALRLMDEVKERLEEEERQCQVSLKTSWDECESCLESNCMRFYTTCKRGLSTFRRKMQKEFDQSFQAYFMSDLDLNESPSMAALPEDTTRNNGSQKGWGIPGFLQIVFDFNCPNVPELHIKFDEAFKLVNLSGEQYEQILQVVQRHTEDTSYLLNKMKERFGWVSELSNMTIGPENIFNIVKVLPGDPSGKNETMVDVNILTSPTFTIKVPPNLDPKSAEFIEYIAGKALQLYKQNF
ncbi:Clul1 [Columba livia]|nr:Clul1 [Columba livia]